MVRSSGSSQTEVNSAPEPSAANTVSRRFTPASKRWAEIAEMRPIRSAHSTETSATEAMGSLPLSRRTGGSIAEAARQPKGDVGHRHHHDQRREHGEDHPGHPR